jgi:hypothetical protein
LSNFIRNNTYDDLIFAQFFNRSVSPGTPPNLNTAVPNYPYLARPTAINSRQLTPGTVIFDDSNPITERNILVTIEEWGLRAVLFQQDKHAQQPNTIHLLLTHC